MAKTFEYPPALVSRRPFHYESAGVYPVALRLSHHFFLTRLKWGIQEVWGRRVTPHLANGLNRELVKCHSLQLSVNH